MTDITLIDLVIDMRLIGVDMQQHLVFFAEAGVGRRLVGGFQIMFRQLGQGRGLIIQDIRRVDIPDKCFRGNILRCVLITGRVLAVWLLVVLLLRQILLVVAETVAGSVGPVAETVSGAAVAQTGFVSETVAPLIILVRLIILLVVWLRLCLVLLVLWLSLCLVYLVLWLTLIILCCDSPCWKCG